MTTFTIDTDNNITAHATLEDAAATTTTPFDSFSSPQEFAELVQSWPAKRLLAIWSSLPWVQPIRKFQDRKIAAIRIWQRIQGLATPSRRSRHSPPSRKPNAMPKVAHSPPRPRRPRARRPTRPPLPRKRNGQQVGPCAGNHGTAPGQQGGPGGGHAATQERRYAVRDYEDHGLAEALCRRPDYADLCWQPGLWGGDRCDGVGIIREPPGRRAVCRSVGNGRVLSLSELSCPERVP